MFWNWYTIDACFFSSTWQISSTASFITACIVVISLVIFLEFLRRSQRELDRYISHRSRSRTESISKADDEPPHSALPLLDAWVKLPVYERRSSLHLTNWQQTARAAVYTMQFGVAYAVMLMAMYYNGFILLCILVGAFLGFWIFARDLAGSGEEAR